MIDWSKLLSGFITNAKVARAGPDGALAYIAAMCLHVRHGRGGRFPVSKFEPDALPVEASALFGRMSRKRIEAALEKCVEAKLLRIADGWVTLLGYDDEVKPQCVRCHQPNDDHRFATCPDCRDKRSKPQDDHRDKSGSGSDKQRPRKRSPQPVATASQNVATCRTGPDRTGLYNPPTPLDEGGGEVASRPEAEPERAARAPGSKQPPIGTGPDGPGPAVAGNAGGAATATAQPLETDDLGTAELGEVLDLQQALMTRTRFRDRLLVWHRRRECLRVARDLHRRELRVGGLERLIALAEERGDQPQALLATWLDSGHWRDVLDEDSVHAREAGGRKGQQAEEAVPIGMLARRAVDAARGAAC